MPKEADVMRAMAQGSPMQGPGTMPRPRLPRFVETLTTHYMGLSNLIQNVATMLEDPVLASTRCIIQARESMIAGPGGGSGQQLALISPAELLPQLVAQRRKVIRDLLAMLESGEVAEGYVVDRDTLVRALSAELQTDES